MKKAELKKCLVTGGAGFLGTRLVKALLEKGCEVIVYDLAPCTLQHDRLTYIKGNICDLEQLTAALDNVDTVFHTAAFIAILGGSACTDAYRKKAFAINVDGTKNVMRACVAKGVERMVYTSSNNVCFKLKPLVDSYETESYCSEYIDLYTETKAIIEPIVLDESGKRGLLTCALRPSGIYGPGDQLVLKTMVELIYKGVLKFSFGNGKAKADNTYVDNLVHAEILAAEHLVPGGVVPGKAYNINDGEALNYFEFIKPIFAAVGKPVPKISIPGWLVYAIAVLLEQFYFRIGRFFNMAEPPARVGIKKVCVDNSFSIERARRDMGYEPVISPAEAMRRSVEYCKELYNQMAEKDAPSNGQALEV